MRIYLVGMMGAGKSYIGRKLAQKLSIDFVDLDAIIEKETQLSISNIFEQYGEAYFRSLEKKYLLKSSSQNNAVFATGGGTPCFNNNMDWINRNGWSIYLKASPSILLQRLQGEQDKRPIIKELGAEGLEKKLKDMLFERGGFYDLAHITWDQDKVLNDQVNELLLSIDKLVW